MRDYSVVQLMDLVDTAGEKETINILSGFSCPINQEIEHFLHKNALDFAKKKMSMTHLVLDEEGRFVGYFTLTHKPINVQESVLSKTVNKRLQRHAKYDAAILAFSASAFLIAQFSKNYAIEKEHQISGDDLMELTLDTLKRAQRLIGGEVVFLECEEKEKLMDFYQSATNRFRTYGERYSDSDTDKGTKYLQMLRFL